MDTGWLWSILMGVLAFVFVIVFGYSLIYLMKGGDLSLPESLYWLLPYLS